MISIGYPRELPGKSKKRCEYDGNSKENRKEFIWKSFKNSTKNFQEKNPRKSWKFPRKIEENLKIPNLTFLEIFKKVRLGIFFCKFIDFSRNFPSFPGFLNWNYFSRLLRGFPIDFLSIFIEFPREFPDKCGNPMEFLWKSSKKSPEKLDNSMKFEKNQKIPNLTFPKIFKKKVLTWHTRSKFIGIFGYQIVINAILQRSQYNNRTRIIDL